MSKHDLKLFNSLTRKVETFIPVHPGEARVYSCGPTVYNYPHIGNMRAYVFADILGRTLSFKGYDLKHVINITDVGHLTDDGDQGDDKMEKMAQRQQKNIWEIAEHYKQAYWSDVKALNIRQPAKWTIATQYVPAMIDFASKIADNHCYELEGGLYFDVSTINDYGVLARSITEEGESRIEKVEGKRNPGDFAVWRKTPAGEKRQMEWDSPWGRGAPGWHLECSVMSGDVLGFPFDIHTGGIDHREVHHPNEIAQNQAICCSGGLTDTANSGARFWMHNNFLVDHSGKMSKSSEEFLRLQLLIDKGYHPLSYRMMCLQAHYRGELEFSWEGLLAAQTRLKRLVFSYLQIVRGSEGEEEAPGHKIREELERFDEYISQDLNTPEALVAFDTVVGMKKVSYGEKLFAIHRMDEVLGFGLRDLKREDFRIRPKDALLTQEDVLAKLEDRKLARSNKDYALSDAIRDDLIEQGVEVMDGDPLGWEWSLEI
jgi:cysteinyl-tRNA synthetase